MRFTTTVVADVTTLNFNLLFEIGFAIGLGTCVIPVRDSSYTLSKRDFEELGFLDTIGYLDFANAEDLANRLLSALPGSPIPRPPIKLYRETPLYVSKGHINTEGAVKLMSTLKKSALRFRTYDPVETPRLSLHESRKQITGSFGLVAHLLSPNRQDSRIHNAASALLAGIAMAEEKVVVMLQEESVQQPIDYRDVVRSYVVPDQIPRLLEGAIWTVVRNMQVAPVREPFPERMLEQVDLGDTAAENEIAGLRSYFVSTGQFVQAKQGHARLVVGRKGSGKTAIFYQVRNSLGHGKSRIVLDLKPEGHQFTKLREAVLSHLSPGLQEHTMTAFWNYILLAEIAHKIVEEDISHSRRDPVRHERYKRLKEIYAAHALGLEDDLSQRLLLQVERVTERFKSVDQLQPGYPITQLLYTGDIRDLNDAVSEYLQEKESVWLLIDNLDKGWPTHGSTSEDILIIRALLEATRKLQNQLQVRDVDFRCLVFLRTDIYEHLIREIPDKGKDTAICLDWDDPDVFEEIVRLRIEASTELRGDFRDMWPRLFDSHIGTEDSFHYIIDRTLMRPRDLLTFVQRAIEVAVSRGHSKVSADDIMQAEQSYSEDMLLITGFEVGDTQPEHADAVYAFQGCDKALTKADVELLLMKSGIGQTSLARAVELLLWFGFLGICDVDPAEAKYSYQVRHNIRHLLHIVEKGGARFVVHPAFRAALGIRGAFVDKYI